MWNDENSEQLNFSFIILHHQVRVYKIHIYIVIKLFRNTILFVNITLGYSITTAVRIKSRQPVDVHVCM